MNRRTTIVSITVVLAVVAFAAAVLLYQRHERQKAFEQGQAQLGILVRDHSPIMGPAGAPVTIVEFFDPACEACRAFYPYVKQILSAYPKDVRLAIRYTPFHGEASVVGVQILEAARDQGRYQPVMEALLEAQPVWASHSVNAVGRAWEYARTGGLDIERARAHAAAGSAVQMLEKELADVKAVGVRATPTFFVNGKPLPSPDPRVLLEMVKAEVDSKR